MDHTGSLLLDTNAGHADFADTTFQIERGSEARRFLFAAAHHGKRSEASLGTFPGKFAWIAVVLFVLSVLIAFVG